MSVTRTALAGVVVAGMGCAIAGIGMGEGPAEREAAPGAAEVAAATRRIEAGGTSVRRGRQLFAEQGCDRCHAIAAIGAEGRLGPRLDTLDEDLDENLENIVEPRHGIVDGYPSQLMPADFDARLGDAELRALAAFVTAASGGEPDGDHGRGRGPGRGRSGGD
jgi:mono/diheme cytochrome c family protein